MAILKPCPFCGSDEVYLNSRPSRYGYMVWIECMVCKAKSAYKTTKTDPRIKGEWDLAEARIVKELWNRRADNEN